MKKILRYVVGIFFLLPILAFAADYSASNTGPWVETDKDFYNYGEQIRVHFYNAPGYGSDWICIVPAGSWDTEAGDYKYLPEGVHEGEMIFNSPVPGEYEVRAYYNYSAFRYNVSARFHFTVEGEGYVYESGYENEYVDVPIAYGEPMYYAPPVTVTFAFDYFTYEIIGGFVDIVFWRGGHRYHHLPWYDHGRRISPDYIRSKGMHHRIRSDEFFKHRERLQRYHNINHPDSYYGLKARSQKPIQRRFGQSYQRSQWEQQPSSQQTQQQPQWGQKPPQQIKQRPQQPERRPQWGQQPLSEQTQQQPQWGQKPHQQIKQRPQQSKRRSQWGQQPSQQTQQQPQWGQKPSWQDEQQVRSEEKSSRHVEKFQEKHKERRER